MATTSRRRVPKEPFHIHEDEPANGSDMDELTESHTQVRADAGADNGQQFDHDDDQEDDEDAEQECDSESSDETEPIDLTVQEDMEKLNQTFPAFKDNYRLIKRIGEGTFSTVYKAEDIRYDRYNNSWDIDVKENQWTPPPPLKYASHSRSNSRSRPPRTKKFVAIKKIYVTSSPSRIHNELELLHDLRDSPSVCPLITAFRQSDQVLAMLPYFRHQDFRKYYPHMTIADVKLYFRSLFTALAAVHERGILHRDIKPTNFLYDPPKQRGVLVDFGLAEREGSDHKPCLCHLDQETRKQRVRASYALNAAHAGPQVGYPKNDTRPSRRANRAGTRGFRAPEVLFKCTEQTTKIDIWSAGVILLTILCKRFPFFNSADDVEAMIEIATIFGTKRMRQAGQLHGCVFETNIPSIGAQGFTLEKIMLWSTCRTDSKTGLTQEEKEAVLFLGRCMELDPSRRISAAEALDHEFLRLNGEDVVEEEGSEEDVAMV
ncbi:kinase-like domain-containing protein [Pseudomassariella vexata]|uniref:non-specific serine/threonine protein kinase n=1 Tax=Pseudomassariella vexata TaxID=1141098 RepID=A0A1Y2DQ09_9PEZI|nr:kinase-like domain-containing protein [Pseudomassariella vexata]ORY60745.1 kinase-like domain-containing protein [Pseudomassariella vexata]